MSTRCQVFLLNINNKLLNYYRHCDGYLSGCGAELLDVCDIMSQDFLGNSIEKSEFFKGNFATRFDNDTEYEYEGEKNGDSKLFIYEDIEYLYFCNDNTGEVYYTEMRGYDNEKNWPKEEQQKFYDNPVEYAKQHFKPLTQLVIDADSCSSLEYP